MPTYLRLDRVAAIVMAPRGAGAPRPDPSGLPRVPEDLSGDLANNGSVCRVAAVVGIRWLGIKCHA
jgi:hypothetical protein